MSSHRSWTVAALTATAALAGAPTALGAGLSPAARVMPGSAQLRLVSSRRLPDGDYETRWRGANSSAEVVAPAGTWIYEVPTPVAPTQPTQVTPMVRAALNPFVATANASEQAAAAQTGQAHVGTLVIVGPQALGDATGARTARRRNPRNHTWFNSRSGTFCYGLACTKAGGRQYMIQERPGQWLVGSYIAASGYGGGYNGPIKHAKISYASAFSKWPHEHGDQLVDWSPRGTTYGNGSSRTVGISLSYGGFGFSESWTIGPHASFGANFHHGTNNPAFGAQWHGCSNGSTADYEDVSSEDVNRLGRGQSPYDVLVEQANYNKC